MKGDANKSVAKGAAKRKRMLESTPEQTNTKQRRTGTRKGDANKSVGEGAAERKELLELILEQTNARCAKLELEAKQVTEKSLRAEAKLEALRDLRTRCSQ